MRCGWMGILPWLRRPGGLPESEGVCVEDWAEAAAGEPAAGSVTSSMLPGCPDGCALSGACRRSVSRRRSSKIYPRRIKLRDMDQIKDNHARYEERKALYKSFGYDIVAERAFVLEKTLPLEGAILEAGTGKGHFALELARAGYRFTTFDISETEQAFARKNIAYFGFEGQVDFRIENGEALSFHDGSFDVVFSINTLHHLRDPYRVVDELIRVLRPSGKMVVSDFTPAGLAIMDKIHALEGHGHEVSPVKLKDAARYLESKGFYVKRFTTEYQSTITASRVQK